VKVDPMNKTLFAIGVVVGGIGLNGALGV